MSKSKIKILCSFAIVTNNRESESMRTQVTSGRHNLFRPSLFVVGQDFHSLESETGTVLSAYADACSIVVVVKDGVSLTIVMDVSN